MEIAIGQETWTAPTEREETQERMKRLTWKLGPVSASFAIQATLQYRIHSTAARFSLATMESRNLNDALGARSSTLVNITCLIEVAQNNVNV